LEKFRGQLSKDKVNVLLFHNSVLGAKHLGWVCDDGIEGDEVCEGFDWVISGHFHEHQEFGKDSTGMYLSAPMHHHYGDVGRDAGFWIIKFMPDGSREDKFIESKLPRFHKYQAMGDVTDARKGDYLRYEVEATHAEWAKLKPEVKAMCDQLVEEGYHADYKHKPIYHHETRLAPQDEAATLTLEDAVSKYAEMTGVVTTGLDVKVLKRIGLETLSAIRSRHGVG